MGKVSGYPTQATAGTAGDYVDLSKDVGGGIFDSQKIEPQDLRKAESRILTFNAARDFNVAIAPIQEMPVSGNCVLSVSGLYPGDFLIYLKADATPRTVDLGLSFGDLLDDFDPIGTTEANKTYQILIIVDPSGNVSHTINSKQ